MKLHIAAVILAIVGCPVASSAQGEGAPGFAVSFEQLQVLVRPGNKVTVTDLCAHRAVNER
jgi:hypothetical protein